MSRIETTTMRVACARASGFSAPPATTVPPHAGKPAEGEATPPATAMCITFAPPTFTPSAQIDHVSADWAGQTYRASSSAGAIPALARILLAAGCPDQAWQAERAGRIVMRGKSLAAIARVTFSDGADGLRVRKWRQPTPTI